jgi:hypothetical protein
MDKRNEEYQTTHKHYLKKERLQELLEELFEGRSDFSIQVGIPCWCREHGRRQRAAKTTTQLRDDKWCFKAPRIVEEVSFSQAIHTFTVQNDEEPLVADRLCTDAG